MMLRSRRDKAKAETRFIVLMIAIIAVIIGVVLYSYFTTELPQ
jgi:flagellar basal body-associated protein FliL